PLARDSGAEFVAGSMGPLGVRLQPYGRVRPEDAFAAYREQASVLAVAGVDLLLVETQTDVRELEQAVRAARDAAPGVALIASSTFTRDDRTLLGATPEEVPARAGRGRSPKMWRPPPPPSASTRSASTAERGRRRSCASSGRCERSRSGPRSRCWPARTPAVRRRCEVACPNPPPRSTWARSPARCSTRVWRSSAAAAAPARRTR